MASRSDRLEGVYTWSGLALLGALVMAAWDLVVDPILSGPTFGAWVWESGGPYFGVPVQNYLGWVVTTLTVYLLYRSVERRWMPQSAGPMTLGPSGLPVLAYAAMMVTNLLSGAAPAALAVIAPVAMGMPVVAGFIRLVSPAGDAPRKAESPLR